MSLPVLIIDGYNIIGVWEDLQEMRDRDMGSAREQLISIMAGYLGWAWDRVIIVFDGRSYAWEHIDGVEVVFTGSRETADTLIERLSAGLSVSCNVEVATSDFAEFQAASNVGARVYSAASLKEQLVEKRQSYRRLSGPKKKKGLMLNDVLNKSVLDSLNKLRRPQ